MDTSSVSLLISSLFRMNLCQCINNERYVTCSFTLAGIHGKAASVQKSASWFFGKNNVMQRLLRAVVQHNIVDILRARTEL